jgi:acetyl-CoA/propionyl-CoA carboxylase biotin carboxyl carrier protein
VTELVTGLDLVEWQLRVASGEPLGFGQDDVLRNGHAIEIRINAENPAGGAFTPSPGTISRFVAPGGPGVRLDAGYESGDTLSQYYDNLLAKLVVWGHDREAARLRMLRAIDETVIEGVATTLPADIAILTNPDFISAQHSTNWVEQTLDLSGVTSTTAGVPPATGAGGDHDVPKVLRDVTAEVDGRRYQVKLWVPDLGDAVVAPVGHAGPARGAGPKRPKAAASGAGSGTVAVPMQGTIVKVLVAAGDAVEVGQTVCVLEAMKMENNVNAEKAGTVTEVKVSAGDSVGPGDVIAVIA